MTTRYYNAHDYDLEYLQNVLDILVDDIEDGEVPLMEYSETVDAVEDDIPTVTFEIEVAPTSQSDLAYLLDLDRMFEDP